MHKRVLDQRGNVIQEYDAYSQHKNGVVDQNQVFEQTVQGLKDREGC